MTTPVSYSFKFVTIQDPSCFTYLPGYCPRVLRLRTPPKFPKDKTVSRLFIVTYSDDLQSQFYNHPTLDGKQPRTLEATCLCGAARHEVSLKEASIPIQAAFYHCVPCRKMSGYLCLTSTPFAKDGTYTPSPSLLKLMSFEFSKCRIHHYFCSTCGAHVPNLGTF